MMQDVSLLESLDQYYDAVPRARSRTEEVGPFTLFVALSGWPYYARPRLGEPSPSSDDVRGVLARQRELNVPQAIEWVDEVTPGLATSVESAGVNVQHCPMLVLEGEPRGEPRGARMMSSADLETLVASRAAVSVSFASGGTGIGPAGIADRDASIHSKYAQVDETLLARLDAGEVRAAVVFAPGDPDLGPVGGGSYSPVGEVAEIAGVGVLPAFRRRGLAAQVTYLLATDALSRGVTTVFCSAQSDDVARIYEGVGFRRVGTACIAEVDAAHS